MADRSTIELTQGAIREWIAADYSMRAALASYRRLGGKIRTDDFARLWRAELPVRARKSA